MGKQPLPGSGVSQRRAATRRTVFVFTNTALFTSLIAIMNYFGAEGPIAERTVDGSFGIIELLVIGFLFTTTMDRSQILDNIGKGFRHGGRRRTTLTDGRDPEDDEPSREDKTYG
ncbi:MAG: hypothetical protein RIA09_15655 [Hoeflea sp.]|jgi:hypothetical protein|uniref:hypothetical protein n=1 Tax=Hoeflea sp. TaxID=1940281 RepID=UPI0032EE430B